MLFSLKKIPEGFLGCTYVCIHCVLMVHLQTFCRKARSNWIYKTEAYSFWCQEKVRDKVSSWGIETYATSPVIWIYMERLLPLSFQVSSLVLFFYIWDRTCCIVFDVHWTQCGIVVSVQKKNCEFFVPLSTKDVNTLLQNF